MATSRHPLPVDEASIQSTPSPILTKNFRLAFAGHFCIGLAFWPYVLLPLFLGNLGYGSFMIGVLMGTASISGVLIRLWVGGELDRRGRKPILIGAAALFAVVNLGYILVDDAGPPIYGLRLLHGLSVGPLFAAIMTFAADIIPETRRTEGLAYFGIAGHLSGAIGIILGEWLIGFAGFPALFLFGAVVSTFAVIFFALLSEPNFKGSSHSSQSLWKIVTDQRFVVLWILSLTFSLGLASYFTFLKPFAESVGLTNVSFFFTTYSSVAVFIRIFGARLPQQLGEKLVLTASLGCLAVGIILIVHLPTTWGLMLTGMLCGIGHGYGFPILSSIIIEVADAETRGSVVTFYTLLFDVGFLIGAPLWGLLISLGSYNVMFTAAAMVVLGGIVLALQRRDSGAPHLGG
ncbi:MAG TPA: MFS transporter [Nitrospirales bacterium]|nr:MFS transporter [Nitrospirales bacterium]HIN34044.1 MFS transporter [Nitrospirales bacterium]